MVLAGLLYLGAAIAVLPLCIANRPNSDALQRGWRALAIAVVAGGAVGPALLIAGLARTSAATASLLLNLELGFTIVLAATVFREHLGRRLLLSASLITTAGVVLVRAPGAEASVGALFVVGACACWGLDNAVTARIDQFRPEHVTLAKGVVAGSANLMIGLALAGMSELQLSQIAFAIIIGALGYGASITLWVKGARDLGAARGQVIFAVAPFVGAIISWVVLRDPVSVAQVVAIPLAVAGVGLSLRSDHEHDHRHHPVIHNHEHRHDDGHHDHDHESATGVAHRHTHPHEHTELAHAHPHLPDLHHRHQH